ncbi:MAG: DUF1631 family protein [Luteimonas sp.]
MTHAQDIGSLPNALRGRSSVRDPARVLESLKRDAASDLVGILAGFWGTIEEQVRLTALAGHNYNASQDDRAALIGISQRAQVFATRYRDAIELEFDRWLEPHPSQPDSKSLTLMSEAELEMHLAGQQTTETLEHKFLHALEVLDDRMQSLAAAMGVQRRQPNPMRPEVPVSAFVNLFNSDDLTPGLRTLVLPLYEKRLTQVLGEIYTKLSTTLDTAGFGVGAAPAPHPHPQHAAASTHPGHGGASGWVPDGGMVEHHDPLGAAMMAVSAVTPHRRAGGNPGSVMPGHGMRQAQEEGRPPRYRDVVREQLRTWRARSAPHGASQWISADGAAHAGGPGGDQGHYLGTEDLLNVATLLQGDDPAPYARALAGERSLAGVIRDEILGGVRQMGLNPADARFSVDEEDAIDLIGILFQSLFEANDLLTRARAMYGRLVVPYLKVALTDDSLFNRRSHPARQLLDVLTEACDGNTGDTPQDQETLERAERAVDRVVGEYQDDQAIFELAAAELRDQLDQQRRRSELAERRAAEAIHGRERLLQARRDADTLVASRLADRALTAPVACFLDEQWRHYLVQMWLRDGADAPRHRAAIGVGDAMVQVDADAAAARGAAVADQLLALQVPLGECYSACGLDAASARDSMARIISALAMPDTPRQVHLPQPNETEAEGAEDEGLAPALRVAAGTDTLDFDPTIAARMRRLRVGQGLRLIDESGHESAARIAWVSPLTSRFLIVNRRGMRKLVVSPEELAAMVATGRAVVRSVDAPFDEAMKQVWQHLNQAPVEESETQAATADAAAKTAAAS